MAYHCYCGYLLIPTFSLGFMDMTHTKMRLPIKDTQPFSKCFGMLLLALFIVLVLFSL